MPKITLSAIRFVPSTTGSDTLQFLGLQATLGHFSNGQDYYNLGFVDDVARFQVGLTYSQEGFMAFRRC